MQRILALTISISASTVAWYAAIVSTLSALVAAYNVWRDRSRLKVTATPNMKLTGSVGPYSEDKTYVLIEAANVGRRAITLSTAALWLKKQRKHVVVVGKWQPKSRLTEGESATILCDQQSLDLDAVARVTVVDATGWHWHGRLTRTE